MFEYTQENEKKDLRGDQKPCKKQENIFTHTVTIIIL